MHSSISHRRALSVASHALPQLSTTARPLPACVFGPEFACRLCSSSSSMHHHKLITPAIELTRFVPNQSVPSRNANGSFVPWSRKLNVGSMPRSLVWIRSSQLTGEPAPKVPKMEGRFA